MLFDESGDANFRRIIIAVAADLRFRVKNALPINKSHSVFTDDRKHRMAGQVQEGEPCSDTVKSQCQIENKNEVVFVNH